MGFKFSKKQRVTVPGQGITQGVIVDVIESVPGCPVYTLRWLTELGEPMTGTVGELNIEIQNPDIIKPGSPAAAVQAVAVARKPKRKSSKRKR